MSLQVIECTGEIESASPHTHWKHPNIRFPGQYFDEETGLHYNRMRYYDPTIGRYISADPIGQWGGVNVFTYARNRPLTLLDALGLVPGVPYSSRREAAIAALADAGRKTAETGNEWGGYITKEGCDYYHTDPVEGGPDRIPRETIGEPPEGTEGRFHAHTPDSGPDVSWGDKLSANQHEKDLGIDFYDYVLNPAGLVLEYDARPLGQGEGVTTPIFYFLENPLLPN